MCCECTRVCVRISEMCESLYACVQRKISIFIMSIEIDVERPMK